MVSLRLTLALLMYFINPLVGFILTLSSIKKEKKLPFFSLSIFFFIIFLYIPPLGDLYRHNITYDLITSDLVEQKKDYIFYYNLLLFNYLNIPFFLIPPIYVAIALYFYLKSFDLFYENSNNKTHLVVSIIIILFSINYISIGSGLRYGLASSIVLFAYSYKYTKNKSVLPFILIILAAQLHFSIYLFLLPVFLSKIKLNIKLFYILCLGCFILSQIAVPLAIFVTDKLNYGSSYITGQWSTYENNNLAGRIRFILNQVPFYLYFFIFFFFIKNNIKTNANINVLYWIILLCLTLSFSITLLLRYALVPTFLLLFLIITSGNISNILRTFLLSFSIFYFSIDTLYGYRRQIELGSMWEALYIPPLIKIFTLPDDYQSMLMQVDANGFWIYNKINLD